MTEELRLLMSPVYDEIARATESCRWVRENGHPGHCGEDCWHISAEAALDCFLGRR